MQQPSTHVQRIPYGGQVFLLACVYFAAAKLSLLFAIPPGYATPVWPPSGIALAASLLLGNRAWPGIWLGAALVNLTIETSPVAAVLVGTGNTLEALVGAALVRRLIGRNRYFDRSEDVVKFVGASALCAAIAATIGVVQVALPHSLAAGEMLSNWVTWWQGDASGMIIVAPLILTWSTRQDLAWSFEKKLEAVCFFALLLIVAPIAFSDGVTAPSSFPLRFLVLPFIIWAAFRFSQREVTSAIFIISGMAVFDMLDDFGSPAFSNESLLVLLAFNSTVAVTGLVLSAVVGERSRAMNSLLRRKSELELRVEERARQLERTNRALRQDIERRERTEKLLQETEQRFSTLLDSIQDYAIFLLDAEGRVASWNKGAQKIKGYASPEIIGRPFACFYTVQDIERGEPQRALELAAREGRHESEGWRVRSDGTTFWALALTTALRDESGALRGFAKITRNLTRRKITEEQLQRSEERFRLMVESIVDYAIFVLDPHGQVVSWNSGAQRINGYRSEEILGRHFSCFYHREDVERGKPQRDLAAAEKEGRCEEEGWRIRKDGDRFWASVIVTPMRGPADELIGYCQVTRDLSERKSVELQMENARAAAEQANRAKSEFLAKMSHELRTPLNSLLILARLLADNLTGNLTPKQVTYATTIHDAGMDLLTLINDILDLARIESGAGITPSIAPVPLIELRNYVEMAFRQVAIKRELQFTITVDERLPAAVDTDARRLQQILKNLLANAFKFTRQGSVSLEIAPATSGWTPGHAQLDGAETVVVFSVADTGIGIPADKHKLIFEPFQQADGTTSRQYGGTGLGLSISLELTKLLGGEIRVESKPGSGSVFRFFLPLAPKRAAGEEAARATASAA
ncbi:MAG TPA: MASE1 domain-containing protein [Burkholderiales bacterium]|nr:MASE1 domain-containing protein [Burkholderiales bacterium]